MTYYKPIYKPNQIITGTGDIVIATGWTPKETVAAKLQPNQYAAVGNLYSPTRGLSFLVRNLLANPHVTAIAFLAATKEDMNAGSVQAGYDFFVQGYHKGKTEMDKEAWLVNSSITSYIDIEIPSEALDKLRHNVKSFWLSSVLELTKLVETIPCDILSQPWDKPQIFPLAQVEASILPGSLYGHLVKGETITETWVKLLQRIRSTGVVRPTGYDGKWQELIDLMAVVNNEPDGFYFPSPNYLPIDRGFLSSYLGQILDDAPYREGVKYTYGQRLRSWFGADQIEQAIAKLIKEIDAASAVMSLWDVADHEKGGSPCLNHIWLRVVDGELSLTATFRSNDMFNAWPANAMGLRALQQHIRDAIAQSSKYDLKMGPLITVSQSAHIYEDTWDNVDRLLTWQYKAIVEAERKHYNDPCGNFVIEKNGKEFVITQTTTGSGEAVKVYKGTNALKLIREIAATNPAIASDHIGYLGLELGKK